MQRRSTARTTPRKKYTVDAFEGVPELAAAISDSDENAAVADEPTDDEDDDDLDHDATLADESGDNEEVDEDDERDDGDDEIIEDAPLDQVSPRVTTNASRPRVEKNPAHISAAKRLWARDLTLPTRHQDSEGYGGFHHSFGATDEEREIQARDGWKWYLESGGREGFDAHQKIVIPDQDQGVQYLGDAEARDFVVGPIEDQKLFHLEARQSLTLDAIWRDADPQHNEVDSDNQPPKRSGFMINLGARISCLEWISNNCTEYQYFAAVVASQSEDGLGKSMPTPPTNKDPRSSVQVWRMTAQPDGRIDDTASPSLKLVLCFSFASIHTIRWCPIPCPSITGTLSLVAIVPDDGVLRVFDIAGEDGGKGTEYRLLQSTSFTMPVEDALCTCIAWMTPSRIAAGYSDGTVRVWNLDRLDLSAPAKSRPQLSTRAHHGYVASILAVPSAPIQVLVTAGLDGKIKQTRIDGEKPKPTTLKAQNNYMTVPVLIYHEFLHRILSFDDDNAVQSYALTPAAQSGKVVAKAPGLVTTLATSPCHPCILLGTANGEVLATNPLQEGLRSRQGPWQQMWFKYEWRKPTADEMRAGHVDGLHGPRRTGLSRILEGFKAVRVPTNRLVTFVLAEEKTAITATSWNKNLRCAGWAAVGMADGMLRIEDLAQ